MDQMLEKVTAGLRHCGSEDLCDGCPYANDEHCTMAHDALQIILTIMDTHGKVERDGEA